MSVTLQDINKSDVNIVTKVINNEVMNVPSQDINNEVMNIVTKDINNEVIDVPSQDVNYILSSSSLLSLNSKESILVNVSTVPSVNEVENEVNIELYEEESSIATLAYRRIVYMYNRLQNILTARRI